MGISIRPQAAHASVANKANYSPIKEKKGKDYSI